METFDVTVSKYIRDRIDSMSLLEIREKLFTLLDKNFDAASFEVQKKEISEFYAKLSFEEKARMAVAPPWPTYRQNNTGGV